MERNLRYKLHKVKKQWVAIGVSTFAAAISVGGQVVAADTVVDTAGINVEHIAETPPSQQEVAAGITTYNNASQEQATTENSAAINVDNGQAQVESDASQVVNDQAQAVEVTTKQPVASEEQSNQAVPQNEAKPGQLETVAGKTYYVDANGQRLKNYSAVVDGKTYYFDVQTGEAKLDLPDTISQNQVADSYQANNQAYSNEASSFETVDNYLTADSWYRPRKVLKNGETWETASEKDYRPILMTWWPDTATKAAYANFWVKEGLISGSYSQNSNARTLDTAVQNIQVAIEKRISQEGNTSWLRDKMSQFVQSQDQWNINSENPTYYPNQDHLQGGALLFVNSQDTSQTNSDYRLLNRNPTYQTGKQAYFKTNYAGYELLLANDVDNSNPIVQAEQLNHFHYLMNWGELVMGDSDANFDGVRIDAVDNVDADLLQIVRDYYKARYGVDKSEKNAIDHLSILEAWSGNDNDYAKDQDNFSLSIDNDQRSAMLSAFAALPNQRSGLSNLTTWGLKNRSSSSASDPIPNYVFIRAHDSEVQTRIAKIIRERLGKTNADGLTNITLNDLDKAFEIYNEDMKATNKQYYPNNLPMAYAWMLQNKDTVTRVYYGDMYTDDGQYMATKTPFYDAIETLLKARIKYVAGGQAASFVRNGNGNSTNNGILTSVRYGKGANSVTDAGNQETRTSGMAVLINNLPNFKANSNVTLNMGAAHKNQAYRPLLLSTTTGIATYLNDSDVNRSQYKYTDSQGRLTFLASELTGVSNTQVSGYLAVWVPVGAADNQDVRIAPSQTVKSDKNIYQQSDALDSQLIYEGFSNFQAFAQTPEQYTNVVIAKNADLFKSWGITQFEMAPQYVSSEDGTFLDSVILNGYAFSDRYDLAMSKNNKYGSKEDLASAIKSLHSAGIKVLADWVPDQMYNLPGKEVVTATRVDQYGNNRSGATINKMPYVVNTRTYGDYQEQYGGAYLEELQRLYPSLFTTKQISTGKTIDPSVKIKNWSAKYFNGTNILGRGAYYVLRDTASKTYLTLSSDKFFLPINLNNTYGSTQNTTGFVSKADGIHYLDVNGKEITNSFKDIDGKLYYFDAKGRMAVGETKIGDATYFFLPSGQALRDGVWYDGTKAYYYDEKGLRSTSKGLVEFTIAGQSKWRYFNGDGSIVIGLVTIDDRTFYFDAYGFQVRGQSVTIDGRILTFDARDGALVQDTPEKPKPKTGWEQLGENKWGYRSEDGSLLTGSQFIDGHYIFFQNDGVQVKGRAVRDDSGVLRFYERDKGYRVSNGWYQTVDKNWVYVRSGQVLTGSHIIDGYHVFFQNDGSQVKGRTVRDNSGVLRFYDRDRGRLSSNGWYSTFDNYWIYVDKYSRVLTGLHRINRQTVYFDNDGIQVKGRAVRDAAGYLRYFEARSGSMVTNRWQDIGDGRWYYFNANGIGDYRW
ncbi:glycoside hydrolase family 70 protein [Streptococcus dentapri]|uniref:dextransucrase n=1 Tax=Streptococcus dentapri TaxID=573564 RepID=A0ABV8CYA4_9STRE